MYQTPAAKAATRALSLLSVSLEKGEVGEYGVNLSATAIREQLSKFFLEELCEYVAAQYGPSNWLEGIPMDIQFVAFTHRPEPDRYGNSVWIELQYNARGHRSVMAMSQEAWLELACYSGDEINYPIGKLSDAITVYMD
jgi:hypothetical protein